MFDDVKDGWLKLFENVENTLNDVKQVKTAVTAFNTNSVGGVNN